MASLRKNAKVKATKAKPVARRCARSAAALKAKSASAPNPLLTAWATPFEMPPFDRIAPEHFLPAFSRAFADDLKEVDAIAGNRARPTFENTIEALERAGRLLDRVSGVFHNLAGSDTNAEIQAIERKIAPR